jgi:transposase
LYRYRAGVPWRDLPDRFGDFRVVHTRFRAWYKCVEIGKPAVNPLIEERTHPDRSVGKEAADTLDRIGWNPGLDANDAAYRTAKRKWAEAVGGSGSYWQE